MTEPVPVCRVCLTVQVVYIANVIRSPLTNNETKILLFTQHFLHFSKINKQKLRLYFSFSAPMREKKRFLKRERERATVW